MRKITMLTLAVLFLSLKPAFAQSITIGELLGDGYKIVAAASEDGHNFTTFVFLQKKTKAYMCIVAPKYSNCFSLNEQN